MMNDRNDEWYEISGRNVCLIKIDDVLVGIFQGLTRRFLRLVK